MYKFRTNEKGLKYIEISNESANAKIAIQGAHLFHYQQVNKEPLLWLSDTSFMEHGEHIRGGVPICWPSFGFNNPELPPHGFARNVMFDLVNIIESDSEETVVILDLKDSRKSRRAWEYKFHLEVKITIGKSLNIELKTLNRDEKSFKFTQALHTYFSVSNISNISIEGLESKAFLNAITNETSVQEGDIRFNQEFDNVYQKVDKNIVLKDTDKEVSISHEGSSSCVVWNPWIEKSKKLSGMRDEAYTEFVCIETANAFDDYIILDSGQSHTLKVCISS